jgi:hypothetical protein
MNSNDLTIRETTQAVIAGLDVGVSNIWERELADEKGVIAPRVSATLSIHDPKSSRSEEQKVFAGTVLSLGPERYLVVEVHEGTSSLGALTLRKL